MPTPPSWSRWWTPASTRQVCSWLSLSPRPPQTLFSDGTTGCSPDPPHSTPLPAPPYKWPLLNTATPGAGSIYYCLCSEQSGLSKLELSKPSCLKVVSICPPFPLVSIKSHSPHLCTAFHPYLSSQGLCSCNYSLSFLNHCLLLSWTIPNITQVR